MKVAIFSTYSDRIPALNDVTAANKQAYCDQHGYNFINLGIDYDRHIDTLKVLQAVVNDNDITMQMGCDTAFTNFDIKIEDQAELFDPRPVISQEELGNNPINNDVMIWKNTAQCIELLNLIINEAPLWLTHGWLWQNHIAEHYLDKVCVMDSRYMNSTFVPWIREGNVFTKIPNASSWQLGDWVIHALGMPNIATRIQVIKWALGNVDGSNEPAQVVWSE
jgi:hypothetical protein